MRDGSYGVPDEHFAEVRLQPVCEKFYAKNSHLIALPDFVSLIKIMKILKCDLPTLKGWGFDGRISQTDFQDAKNVALKDGVLNPSKNVATFLCITYVLNAAGTHVVSVLLKEGLITQRDIMKVKGIPFVTVVFDDKK